MRRTTPLAALCAVAVLTASCAAAPGPTLADGLQVVATTPLIADLVAKVAGPDAAVTTLVPPGKDPHSFEPSLRTVRDAAHADIAFANGLLLEPAALMDTVRKTTSGPVIEIADHAMTQGAVGRPLVEDITLDAIWLGLRIAGSPDNQPRTVRMVAAAGPGDVAAYAVSTFGTPNVFFNSADEVNDKDAVALPANAHTHVSWAFSQPGDYVLRFDSDGLPATDIHLSVGSPAPAHLNGRPTTIIDGGHVDITADVAQGHIRLRDQDVDFDPATTVIAVPSKVFQEIPADPSFRFLGVPGTSTYLLPQAVLGAHMHGEIDPHLWHNVANVRAYVDVIAEELSTVDPSRGESYRQRAQAYKEQLSALDAAVAAQVATIPAARRNVISPHHGFGYLDQGYGIASAGFLSPNPTVEPTPRDVAVLRQTLIDLQAPAVFVEPQTIGAADTLRGIAGELGLPVCTLYADTLDDDVTSYVDLMEFNAAQLQQCLGGAEPDSPHTQQRTPSHV